MPDRFCTRGSDRLGTRIVRALRSISGNMSARMLLAFLVVALVPLTLQGLIHDRNSHESLTGTAYRGLLTAASRNALDIDTFINTNLSIVETQAHLPMFATYLTEVAHGAVPADLHFRVQSALDAFVRRDPIFIRSYALLDMHGRSVIDTDSFSRSRREADYAHFQQALAHDRAYASPVQFVAPDDQAVLYFSSPVHDQHRAPVGVLRVRFSAAILQHLIARSNGLAGPRSFAYLVDEHGVLLANSMPTESMAQSGLFSFVAPPVAPYTTLARNHRLPPPVATTVNTTEQFPDLAAGLLRVGSAQPFFTSAVPNRPEEVHAAAVAGLRYQQGWRVVFFLPHTILLAPVVREQRQMFFLALIIIGVVSLLAWLAARSLSQPIRDITAMAQRLASGDLNARTQIRTFGQLGILARTFNDMASDLQEHENELARIQRDLEQRVLDRTDELSRANEQLREEMRARAEAQREREELTATLLENARYAGMSEIATSVLHNLGNVLNSVNIAAQLIRDQLEDSQIDNLKRLNQLLAEHCDHPLQFVAEHPRGRLIPQFLLDLTPRLLDEHHNLRTLTKSLNQGIEIIKGIVAVQQSYARSYDQVRTPTKIAALVEDALRINQATLRRHAITVQRDYAELPKMLLDRYKIIQILINLVDNAATAMRDVAGPRCLNVRVFCPNADRIAVEVRDTGVGIAPEHMDKVFRWGHNRRITSDPGGYRDGNPGGYRNGNPDSYTDGHSDGHRDGHSDGHRDGHSDGHRNGHSDGHTDGYRGGHGFGLHSGLLAARNLGGTLRVASDGCNQGAAFTLELPMPPTNEHCA